MKALKKTGLVPVKAKTRYGNVNIGETFGLNPEIAAKGIALGELELVPISPVEETFDVPDPVIETKDEVAKLERKASGKVDGPVVIPEDWDAPPPKGLHHLQIGKLAKDILGIEKLTPPDGVTITEFAKSVIRKELEQRSGKVEEQKTGAEAPASDTQ